ncbi:MAG: hypothetical protein L3I91_02700 [Mycoplasma sp.]
MNFAFVIGKIEKIDGGLIYIKNEPPFYADMKIEKEFCLPICVNPQIFKRDYEIFKSGLLVSIKCRIELENSLIKLVAERINYF